MQETEKKESVKSPMRSKKENVVYPSSALYSIPSMFSVLLIGTTFIILVIMGLGVGFTGTPLWGKEAFISEHMYRFGLARRPVKPVQESSLQPFAHPTIPNIKLFTEEQLRHYNGQDQNQILVGIKGRIFDVTNKKSLYGLGGTYADFAAKDASRAFLDLCFTQECIGNGKGGDLSGLGKDQMDIIDGWLDFYFKNYPLAGYVKGRVSDDQIMKDMKHIKELRHNMEKIDEDAYRGGHQHFHMLHDLEEGIVNFRHRFNQNPKKDNTNDPVSKENDFQIMREILGHDKAKAQPVGSRADRKNLTLEHHHFSLFNLNAEDKKRGESVVPDEDDSKDEIKEKLHNITDEIVDKAHDIKEGIRERVHNLRSRMNSEEIKEDIKDKAQEVKDKLSDIKDDIVDKAHDIKEEIRDTVHNLQNRMLMNQEKVEKDNLVKDEERLQDQNNDQEIITPERQRFNLMSLHSDAQHMKKDIENMAHDMKNKARDVKDDIKNKAGNVKDDLEDAAHDMKNKARDVKDDIKNKAGNIQGDLEDAAHNIKEDLKPRRKRFGLFSLNADAEENEVHMHEEPQDIKSKMRREAHDIKNKARQVKEDIKDKAAEIKENIKNKANEIKEEIKDKAQDMKQDDAKQEDLTPKRKRFNLFNLNTQSDEMKEEDHHNLKNKAREVKEDLANKSSDMKEDLENKAHSIKDEIKDKANDIKEDIKDKATSAMNKARDIKEDIKIKARDIKEEIKDKATLLKEKLRGKKEDDEEEMEQDENMVPEHKRFTLFSHGHADKHQHNNNDNTFNEKQHQERFVNQENQRNEKNLNQKNQEDDEGIKKFSKAEEFAERRVI